MRQGRCPSCGTPLSVNAPPDKDTSPDGASRAGGPPVERPDAEGQGRPKAPWLFTLLLIALVLYLGFRAYQGVFWVVHHL